MNKEITCPVSDCVYSKNCGILEITGKIPKDKKCSYFTKESDLKRKHKKSSNEEHTSAKEI